MNTEEEKLLAVVLETAGDNERMVQDGIIKALRGVNDKARRVYLWNILSKAARGKICRERRQAELKRKLKQLEKMREGGALDPQQYLKQCATVRKEEHRDKVWNRGLDSALKNVLLQK